MRRHLWTTLAAFAFATAGVLCISAPAQAQATGSVVGQVVDATSGAPLGGIQVYLPQSGLGALSRQDGRFIIVNVPAGSHEVRAQRIGMTTATQTVTVAAGQVTQVDFELQEEALGLDEIVVTGTAGAARRREVGNAISQLDVANLPVNPISTTSLLQGSATGISITGGSGQAGQGKQIRLRGNSSISMSNRPIIYIDGVRMMDQAFPWVNTPGTDLGQAAMVTSSPLDLINPNDLERIEIIKGSAATTLYGSEASSGVIQIFTKRGSAGTPVWTAEMQQGTGWVQKFGANGADYLHMEHYMRDAWWGGGYEGGQLSEECVTDDARWKGVNHTPQGACSWPGAMWTQSYSLGVRAGTDIFRYYLSGQVQNDTYILPDDALKKYNLRGNFTVTPVEDLQIQWNTGYTNQWQRNSPSGNAISGIELSAFRQERNYIGSKDPRVIAQVFDYDYQHWIERFTSGITLTHTPLSNLTNRLTLGYNMAQQQAYNIRPWGFFEYPTGSIVNDLYQNRVLTLDYVSTLSFGLAADVRSELSVGGQAISDDTRRVIALGKDFPGTTDPTLSSAATSYAEEVRERVWNAGFFVQNVFDVSNKYFVTAGVRVDGNSAFGTGFGLQVYPKVSASWVISDESFWSADLGTLKLRAAYGKAGKAPGAFDAVRTWQGVGFAGAPAFRPANLGNPDLGPEVTAEWEMGLDGSFLDDRLGVAFTYYHQSTTDALMRVNPLPSQGFRSSLPFNSAISSPGQLQNVGELENKGIELQLDGSLIRRAGWGLDVGLGISTNHSKVVDLGDLTPFDELNGTIMEGQPIPVAYAPRVANPDEIAPFVYENDGEDVVIGPIMPTHYVTPTLTLRFPGNILLSARGEYRGGNYMYINEISVGRSIRSPLCFPYYVDPANSIDLKDDIPALWRERCTPGYGDDYWFDADYFKLRSVSAVIPVGFAFPQAISNATITMELQNAWDWYREIPWYDPEILGNHAANDPGIGGQSERTPAPATFRISLRVTF